MNPNGSRDKTFRVAVSEKNNLDIKIHVPALRAQGLDLTPWASTYVLAGVLHTLNINVSSNKSAVPILELGAGIGLVGIVASILWRRHVVLTDLGPIVPGLSKNIDLNLRLLQKYEGSASAGELDWDKPQELISEDGTTLDADRDKAHIILAADTIYSEEHPPMLAKTILKWLAPGPDSRVILTYPLRVAYLDQVRDLWELLETGGLTATQEGKEEAAEVGGDSWDDERLCEWSVWKWKDS